MAGSAGNLQIFFFFEGNEKFQVLTTLDEFMEIGRTVLSIFKNPPAALSSFIISRELLIMSSEFISFS